MESVFDYLLTAPLDDTPQADVALAWARHRAIARQFATPLDAAIAGGFGADRLGYAFLSGYQEALRTLMPGLPEGEMVALSATETGGAHPAAIETVLAHTVDGWTVSGAKTFTTLGAMARRLIVIASVGADSLGRNALRAALVDVGQPGVTVTNLAPIPFAPEIPHATVTFADARAEPLPGDGYAEYLKPFRTLEDGYVLGATLGWLVRMGRAAGWSRSVRQGLLAAVAAVRGLDWARPGAPGTHIALGGVFAQVDALVTELDPQWPLADPVHRERWERDRPLLGTAGRVRAMRLDTAWRSVGDTGEPGAGKSGAEKAAAARSAE